MIDGEVKGTRFPFEHCGLGDVVEGEKKKIIRCINGGLMTVRPGFFIQILETSLM